MNKSGFTLVEVLATITILAAVMIIAIPAYGSVANSIKTSNLSSKEKAIDSAMLKYANKYLIDDIKPANVRCVNETECCKQYDLYTFIVENGIYTPDETTLYESIIINPLNNEKLLGCVKIAYNISTYNLEASFHHNCNMENASEKCR